MPTASRAHPIPPGGWQPPVQPPAGGAELPAATRPRTDSAQVQVRSPLGKNRAARPLAPKKEKSAQRLTPGPPDCPSSRLKKRPLCLSPGRVTLCCSHPSPRCSQLPGPAGFGFGFGVGPSQGPLTGQTLTGVSSGPYAGDPPFSTPTPSPVHPQLRGDGRGHGRAHSPAQRCPLSAPDQPNGDERVHQTQGHVKENFKTGQTRWISVLGKRNEELAPRSLPRAFTLRRDGSGH